MNPEKPKNPEDYAIIIGLQNYPGINDLDGPENDARAFRDWAVSPTGGGVPNDSTHLRIILSSDNPLPFQSMEDAKPVASEIENAFRRLRRIHLDNIDRGVGPRIGRRLYIYMAGHGIAPTSSGSVNQQESALLMANVDPSAFGPSYQIPGAYTATWFSLNDCFAEIFLFMDCCRGAEWVPGINIFLPPEGTSNVAKRCYAFGTTWGQNAREKPMRDEGGAVRGVFTKTLLMGLSGGAAIADLDNPAQGTITVSSLKGFIHNQIKTVLNTFASADDSVMNSPDTGSSVDIPKTDINYWPNEKEGKDIVITTVPMSSFRVVIRPPDGQTGRGRVFRHFEDDRKRIAVNDTMNADWPLSLQRGLYYATFIDSTGNDIETKFEVEGDDGESVTLVTF